MFRNAFCTLIVISLFSCSEDKQVTLFELLPAEETGIHFNNVISETDSINIILMEYVYNGGGVATADFNNDGFCDIFFVGNIVPSKLFLNQGSLKFKDVTKESNLYDSTRWRSGVAVVDINSDGWKDLYVCATISGDSTKRANLLYVNQGLSKDGIPYFEEMAKQYGIADTGHSSNAAFFDYDNDGDLDLYVLTNTIEAGIPTSYRAKITDGSALNTDRLYRNNGNGTFSNVSEESGILLEGYGLGLAIADINNDGWQDIYVSNDYITNDILYINNKDGTFTNKIDDYIKHQSQFSMGNDIADFNNDGLLDIITLDMLPEGNLRRKTVINGSSYTNYLNNQQYGYTNQYIRNMLQLNNGNGTFSEIGQLAGVHQTEWSWSPLFADFDNDGLKDIIITNGFPKDVTDKDFSNFRNGAAGAVATPMFLSDSIPVVKVSNQIFKNVNGLKFTNKTKEWGMDIPSFSSGAAYADFDNDGDLDYVVNNINDNSFLFENKLLHNSKDTTKNGFLRLKLVASSKNGSGLGTKISVKLSDGTSQYFEHSIYRGYISTVENLVHVGLGLNKRVDSLWIRWPSGKVHLITDIDSNQTLELEESTNDHLSTSFNSEPFFRRKAGTGLLTDVSAQSGIQEYVHKENDYIDFNIQRTIPHKFSQFGPGLSVGDIDGNGLDDFFIGGSASHEGTFFFQQDTRFTMRQTSLKNSEMKKNEEDQGSLLFDFDNDGDLDLYIVSGGNESKPFSDHYQDRFYVNDGKGNFSLRLDLIPKLTSSKSCVRAADFDKDGDLDLFLGSRVIPWTYPLSSTSYILKNDNGVFVDVTGSHAPQLSKGGMVTDGIWSDFNNDGWIDLITVGEFEQIKMYKNQNGKLTVLTDSGVESESGWWNSIAGADFDNDGDIDYVIGNYGMNNYYNVSKTQPLSVYAKDVDNNGSLDAVISCFFKNEQGEMKEFPVHFWDELSTQSPVFRRKFSSYKHYGSTEMISFFDDSELEGIVKLSITNMNSSFLRNEGGGKFNLIPLPFLTQSAPVNGIVISDFNADDFYDVLLVGNDFGAELFGGRQDSFVGQLLLGDGQGFSPVSVLESNFFVDGDAKALVRLSGKDNDFIIASQNRDSLKVFTPAKVKRNFVFKPQPLDAWAILKFADGKKQKVEFYYGSGYLSQSTRNLNVPKGIIEIEVFNSRGESRKIVPEII